MYVHERGRARVSEHRGDCGRGRRVTCRRCSRAYASAAHVTAARNHTARGTRASCRRLSVLFSRVHVNATRFVPSAAPSGPATYIRLIDWGGGEQSAVTITDVRGGPNILLGGKKNYRFASFRRPLLQDEKCRNTVGYHVKGLC